MQTIQNQTILLIGGEPDRLKNLSSMFQQIGYNVLTARDGREGFSLARRASPDLIISEMNLPIVPAVELCRMIRADRALWAIPLMFLSESRLESERITEFFDAGADECFDEFFNPQYLAAKAAWLIKRKHSENYLAENYEIIRRRQINIAQIIKGTAGLFSASALERQTSSPNEFNSREFNKNLSHKIDFGMNMINALANLLEEQMSALETWKRARHIGELNAVPRPNNKKRESGYETIIYDLIDDSLPA